MLKCPECKYESNRLYNLEGHIKRKHKIKEKPNENTLNINKNKDIIDKNKEVINGNTESLNGIEKYKCEKCIKVLKSKQSLNYHINICKGVSNILECHYCHKILSDSSSKAKHLKICKAKSHILTVIPKEQQPIINNIDQSTHITNNNNITLISFNLKQNEYTKFITDHISDKEITKILRENKTDYNHLIEAYLSKLYDNPLNVCIRKISEKSGYSNINQSGKWIKELDTNIYPHLVKDVSNDLCEKVDELIDEDKIKGKYIDDIHTFLTEIMMHIIDDEDLYIIKNKYNIARNFKKFMLNQ